MQAGKLRHLVVLEDEQETQDPTTGVLTRAWVEVAQVWAAVEPLSAREFIASQAAQSEVTTRITIRYRAGVRASMRIRHDGRIFNIAGVLPDRESGRAYLTLPCSEGVNQGSP